MITQDDINAIYKGWWRSCREDLLRNRYPPDRLSLDKELIATVMLEDHDAAVVVCNQTGSVAECVERCKQILVLKGELP